MITESPVHPRDLYLDIVQTNIYLQLSRSQDPRGYLDLASNMLQSALKKNPRNVYLANGCGIVLYRTGKIQQAINVFKKVRENSLSFISACVNLAHLHLIEKRYYDASGLYQTILQQEGMKTDIQLHLCLALAQMRCGQHVQAQETLMRVQKLDPTVSICNVNDEINDDNQSLIFIPSPITITSRTLKFVIIWLFVTSAMLKPFSRRLVISIARPLIVKPFVILVVVEIRLVRVVRSIVAVNRERLTRQSMPCNKLQRS